MKTVAILLLCALLASACVDQKEDREQGAVGISEDSLAVLQMQTLREWTRFNTTADSIVAAAGATIEASRKAMATPRVHQRGKLQRAIIKSNYSLHKLKKHIAAVEALEVSTDTFDVRVERRLDSIREKFDREKIVLDRCLKELQDIEHTIQKNI